MYKINVFERVGAELARLKKRLEREKMALLEAEALREKATQELYEKQRELELLRAISTAANEASSVEEAMQTAIDLICVYTGWPVGHVYMRTDDSGDKLISTMLWHLEDPERFDTFRKVTENTIFGPGVDLPGRVLISGRPAWIIDVTKDKNFPRSKHSEDIGMRAGFALPVLVGAETVGVLEFFSSESIEPDERLLEAVAHIGTQLGRVVERKRAEDTLQRAHDELEIQVRKRTAELENINNALQAEIAERTRTEQELSETQERYRTLVEHTYDLIAETSIDGRFLYVNPKHTDVLGYEPSELLGTSIFTPMHPDDVSATMSEFTKSLRAFSSGQAVHRYKHKNGHWVWLETIGRPFKTAAGEVRAVLASRDITERKHAEEVLRESEEKYRAIVEHTYDLISETSIDGRFLYVSPKYQEIVGYESCELLGKNVSENMHPQDRANTMAEFQRAVVTRSSGHAVYRYRHKNGRWLWFESTGRIFQTATGETRGVITSRDITERKRAEENQAQLLKELQVANQELKDFAYVVSHDLKAPLRAISSLADWIATDYRDKLDEEGKEQLDLLISRVKRMHSLVDGILQYSRVGRIREEKVEVNLRELVAEVIDMIVPPENIEIKVENELPSVLCEKTRIEQVFQNLLSNAVKFMDKPKGEIRIGCVQDGSFWKFSVSDNGPGIEEKYFKKIFQMFQTLTPRDESENTGIGLALVKKIIEMYGGKIWVESKAGHGSTFFFTMSK
ncbi:MAG TPA: PAS domain S-box protein [Thermodesulfobacteriota bacterium]|nr:PAS domain S-box protein [Thermodesulfobacteriota bacterium]